MDGILHEGVGGFLFEVKVVLLVGGGGDVVGAMGIGFFEVAAGV